MDRSTIWPYFPRFLIARPQFLRFWRACTAFMTTYTTRAYIPWVGCVWLCKWGFLLGGWDPKSGGHNLFCLVTAAKIQFLPDDPDSVNLTSQ
eukprot:scaffold50366_cov64-Cyclotella_meneghiniana.AAC.1